MNPIVTGIISGIIITIFSYIILHYVRKFFFYRPKIYIKIKYHSTGGGTIENNIVSRRWFYNVLLQNNTKYDAVSVSIDYHNLPKGYDIQLQDFNNIKGLSSETTGFSFYYRFEKEIVDSANVDLNPMGFKDLIIILTYSNEMEQKFYTKYIHNKEKNSFHRRKPKIK